MPPTIEAGMPMRERGAAMQIVNCATATTPSSHYWRSWHYLIIHFRKKMSSEALLIEPSSGLPIEAIATTSSETTLSYSDYDNIINGNTQWSLLGLPLLIVTTLLVLYTILSAMGRLFISARARATRRGKRDKFLFIPCGGSGSSSDTEEEEEDEDYNYEAVGGATTAALIASSSPSKRSNRRPLHIFRYNNTKVKIAVYV